MTERLSRLMQAEVDILDVPTPRPLEVIATGRRSRGRRRLALAAATSGAAAVVLAVVWVALPGGVARTSPPTLPPTAHEAYLHQGAFAVGGQVHFGLDPDLVVDTGEKVKSLYYTSVGVLIRTGDVSYLDDGGPSHYLLVRSDGSTRRLDLDLGDRAPSTDPRQPYLAYADPTDSFDRWDVVILDVDRDVEVARVPVQGRFSWGGWVAPPVALVGDHVYVGMDQARVDVDWRAGSVVSEDESGGSTYPEVAGHYLTFSDDHSGLDSTDLTVTDVDTGETVLSRTVDSWAMVTLSPNGRYAQIAAERGDLGPAQVTTFEVYDLASGRHRTITGDGEAGWTPDDQVLYVSRDHVKVCDPATGDCESATVELGDGTLKVGGRSYES